MSEIPPAPSQDSVQPGPPPQRSGRWAAWALPLAFASLAAGLALGGWYLLRTPVATPPSARPPEGKGDVTAQVHAFCGACHLYPPPDTFPRSAWEHEVTRGYRFFEDSGLPLRPPPLEPVVKYFKDRAPDKLPPANIQKAATPLPVQFTSTSFPGPRVSAPYSISHVNLVRLFDAKRLDLLACDMRNGLVMVLQPYAAAPAWRVLAEVAHPAHAEVVDLDGDGINDVVVANLGSFPPTDRRCGSVVWLRGQPDGRFTPFTLLDGVGRVADVQAADFRGTGRKDLVVAAFGWQKTGEILLLENRTTNWSQPRFEPRVLDDRHGTIHVPVADLNGDGKPDFVALISQEHETVVAFLNEGDGRFRKEILYTAAHPGYGSSGIQLVDLDGDGELDVLYSNGDVLDAPYLLKPYHGVQWLQNPGKSKSTWKHHPVAPMYGVHRAVAGDLTGSGKKDILAVCFLPRDHFPERGTQQLDSILLLEQTALGQFARHALETVNCDYVSCVAGDLFGTGRADLAIGYYGLDEKQPPVTIWRNLGRR